jgi:hypothetical protein
MMATIVAVFLPSPTLQFRLNRLKFGRGEAMVMPVVKTDLSIVNGEVILAKEALIKI